MHSGSKVQPQHSANWEPQTPSFFLRSKGFEPYFQHFQFWLPPDGWAPQKPSSESKGAFIHETHQTSYKEAVLNKHVNVSNHFCSPQRAQHRGSRQKHLLPSLSLKGLNCILYELLPEGLASKISTHLEAGCDLPGKCRIQQTLSPPSSSLSHQEEIPSHQYLHGTVDTQVWSQLLWLLPEGQAWIA